MPRTNWEQADGRVVKIESIYPRGRRQLIVTFSYEVHEHCYESELYTFESMTVGQSVVVKYDASNPEMTGFKAAQTRKWAIWWTSMGAIVVTARLLMLWLATSRH